MHFETILSHLLFFSAWCGGIIISCSSITSCGLSLTFSEVILSAIFDSIKSPVSSAAF